MGCGAGLNCTHSADSAPATLHTMVTEEPDVGWQCGSGGGGGGGGRREGSEAICL